MNEIMIYLLPIIIIQIALQIFAIVKIAKQKTFKYFSKAIWIIIVLLGSLIGTIIYLLIERDEY